MSLHDDAAKALGRDPGVWALGQSERYTWPQIAQQLHRLTGVGPSWRTVLQWAQHATPARVRVVDAEDRERWLADPPEHRGVDRSERWRLVNDPEGAGRWGLPQANELAAAVAKTWQGARKLRAYAERVEEQG